MFALVDHKRFSHSYLIREKIVAASIQKFTILRYENVTKMFSIMVRYYIHCVTDYYAHLLFCCKQG